MSTAYLPQHRKTYSRWLVAIGLTVTLGFCVICAAVFNSMGRRDYEQARQSAINVTTAISSDIERTIELYNLSLQAVVEGMSLPEIWALEPHIRQLLLFDRAATAKYFGEILVIDREGRVIISSLNDAAARGSRSSSDYFVAQQSGDGAGFYMSRPTVNSFGEYVVNVSRRLSAADGSFNGVVAGSVKLSLFHDLFRQVNVGDNDTLTLTLQSGTIVLRSPFDIDEIGRDISQALPFQNMLLALAGSFESTSQINNLKRLYVYRKVRNAPLYLSYAQSVTGIFQNWWKDAWIVAAIVFLLCSSNIGLIIFLARALKKNATAEYSLSVMSVIDNLTGLFNRRKFDEVLNQEWRRAQRAGYPIAALMIDADNFKAFNDQYGHQAGDVALKNLAACIQKSALRSTDLCARYGGEEFVVILPMCDARQAEAFAERLRENVSSLRRRQLQGEVTPTVSIGISAVVPIQGLQSSDLIEAADAALYQAKLKGRNCVVLASPPAEQLDAKSMVA
jgi:diguanylate cyclase (GGDEF)-like protein